MRVTCLVAVLPDVADCSVAQQVCLCVCVCVHGWMLAVGLEQQLWAARGGLATGTALLCLPDVCSSTTPCIPGCVYCFTHTPTHAAVSGTDLRRRQSSWMPLPSCQQRMACHLALWLAVLT